MSNAASQDETEQDWQAKYEALASRHEALAGRHEALAGRHEGLKTAYDAALFELQKALRGIFGQKRERATHEGQLSILDLLGALGVLPDAREEAAPTEPKDKPKRKKPKKGHGRRKLSMENLPVVDVTVEPAERTLEGGDELVKIGEEVSEHLEYRPSSLVRVRVTRPKYRRPDTEESPIVIAEVPERAAPRSLAGPGLLAHVLVSKYGDHIPLYRQEQIFKRQRCSIPRSTLCGWVKASATWLEYITDMMWHDAKLNASYFLVDATGVLVQAPRVCKRTHFYTAVVPGRHVLYRHLEKNDGTSVADAFEDFSGYMHVDASSVYHELFRKEDVIEVGCWAHARRKFFDILERDRERALMGIGLIGQLYEAQRKTTDDDGVIDGEARARACRPILARLLRWARSEMRSLPENPRAGVAQALRYLIRHRAPLTRFLEDGRLRLDNNPAELALRHEVIGRKNWIFCGSDDGARWNTVAVSLIASCKMHGLEPWAYLRDVLTLLPAWKTVDVLGLAPVNWTETLARPETQALLANLRVFDETGPHENTTADRV